MDPLDALRPDASQPVGVARLWVDGKAVDARDATVVVDPVAGAWRLVACLPGYDPFLRSYGLSIQTVDGRTLHGRARLSAAEDGALTFDGLERPEGAW